MYRSVVQWFVDIINERYIVFSAVSSDEQRRVVVGRCDKRKDLACGRLDGHYRADFVAHELFAVFLKFDVDGKLQIVSRFRRNIVDAVLIFSLDASARIAHQNLHPLFPA